MPLILLVDDDVTQRLATGSVLKKAGHQILHAEDGMQGLEMARTHEPELIVCDVVMPGMNGYQMVTALRQEPGIADTPVIMLTSMAERMHMRLGMTSGADDYLAKPFSSAELCDAVSALLAKRKVQREQIVSSVKDGFMAALDEQKQNLASQYEKRLVQELDSRWDREKDANSELKYDDATVLLIDLFGSLLTQPPAGTDLATLVRRRHQAARDTLYLFGAKHLLPYGNDLLAVFAGDIDAVGTSPKLRALRAAFALVKAAVMEAEAAARQDPASALAQPGITTALHEGTLTLLRVSDPLHGGPDSTLATGEILAEAAQVLEFACASGWRIACTQAMAEANQQSIVVGRRAAMASGKSLVLEAVELVALS